MKRNNLILGGIGAIAIASSVFFLSKNFDKNNNARYSKDRGSLAATAGAVGYQEWLKTTMIDVETGEMIKHDKLVSILEKQNQNQTKALNVEWREHGPDNIGGRTRAIHVDHTDENIIWAGGVAGGLYKSENKANNWSRVESFIGGQFISAIGQDSEGNVYVATGSYDENINNNAWSGQGLFVSPDGGETWQVVPGTENYNYINRIASSKYNSVIYFTHASGLKKYTFGGTVENTSSYGGSGSKTLAYSDDGQALVVASDDANAETWVSLDWGETFNKVSSFNTTPDKITEKGFARIEYAISKKKSDGTYSIYAATASANNQGQWISLDNGTTWHKHTAATSAESNNGVIDYRNQGVWNNVVSFDPTDTDRVIVGGIDLHEWKKQINNPPSGGWTKLSLWFVNPTNSLYNHADNHVLKWASDNRLYVGNDGGVSVSLDKGATYYPANRGYNITQFYAIGVDRYGAVIGGTQDNGTLYNDHTNATYKEFKEVSGGDGFTSAISFYNPDVMITSIYHNSFYRSGDGGESVNSFIPNLPGYEPVGLGSTIHPFHTQFHLAEYFDENSKDSVIFIPRASYEIGETVKVPSMATGDTIEYVTYQPIQFDDTLYYDPSLTTTEYTVLDSITGNVYDLGFNTYTPLPSASGTTPPSVGDSIEINLPSGIDTVLVNEVTPYDFHYGSNATNPSETIAFGRDTVRLAIAWDTLTVQDPYQSWFVFSTRKNGTELWGTRDALRLSNPNPKWVRIAEGIGNDAGQVDVAFSKDLNHLFVTAGGSLYRVDSLGSAYSTDDDFEAQVDLDNAGGPTLTSMTTVGTGTFSGVGLNPNNPDDVVVVQQFSGSVSRSSNATSASPSLTTVGSQNGIAFYDVIIDRDDSDILFATTYSGVSMSEDGGATWNNVADPSFDGVPSYRLLQAWRTWEEGNHVPGRIFVGTHGRGIWSTDAVLNVTTTEPLEDKKETDNFSLEIYPNPSKFNTTLIVDVKQSKALDIQFYNISGRLVKRIRKTDAHIGRNEIGFSVSDLPQGTYLIRVQSGDQIENTKFVKM
ncbi:hypothetical protein CW751_06790 [Brumimicrobium salinarum]|uniref:Secretion system C-terminal sorting domain-containing protein n=1 Tax=Brumimicrobium salinarum TaxID=2058658 RepID=A0A2I0R2R0_9FLAO|nr:T9SS type A sorting domain-containing protein [Brumimicrobium salinarum]PKR80872.1 hypothetical protein CW751_06790 [Brumimicrobium salinarum]